MTIKSALVYGICLAMGLCLSAWMGLADARAANYRSAMTTMSAKQTADTSVDESYQRAAARQRTYQTTRSLVPLARPLASSTTATQARIESVPQQSVSGTVLIQPLGRIRRLRSEDLAAVRDTVTAFFGTTALVGSPVRLDKLPAAAVRARDNQPLLDAGRITASVLQPKIGGDIGYVLGITTDAVHNNADSHNGSALIRANLSSAGTAISLDLSRQAVRALCQSFGLVECAAYACLMNSAPAHNATPLALCPDCLSALSNATGDTPARHINAMRDLCRQKGFLDDARYYTRAAHMVK